MPRGAAPILSDEEKKRRGNFSKKYSAEEIADRRAKKVLAFPTLRTIPEPDTELSDLAKAKYNSLVRDAYECGRLTEPLRMKITVFAITYDAVMRTYAEGRVPSGHLIAQYNRIAGEVSFEESAKPLARAEGPKEKFRHAGFASRVKAK